MTGVPWRDEMIQQAGKWPARLRARLDTGIWRLLGADEGLQQEFKLYAGRLKRELQFPDGDADPVTVLLYRLKQKGDHTWSSQRLRRLRAGSAQIISNQTRASIYPLRRAVIQYLSQERLPDPNAQTTSRANTQTTSRAPAADSGQAAAALKNREREVRARIIGALQSLFSGDYAQWPDFVREYYTDMQAQPEYRQRISPSPFQPPVFDRLKQSPEEWVKTADSAWLRHRDRFLRACKFWVTAGVDQEIPAVKRVRGCGAPDGDSKRGDNTALERRYEWAAKYLLDISLKEIAAQDGADPSTVGRIARRVLQQASWLASAKCSKRGSQTADASRA